MTCRTLRFLSTLLLIGLPLVSEGRPSLQPGSAAIGQNLQTSSTVVLSQPAEKAFTIVLMSTDPSRLLLAKMPDQIGSASIEINVRPRFRESPEFWLQALGNSGQVSYTANAQDFDGGTGTVTLSKSGIALVGPGGQHAPEFVTTPRGWPAKLSLHTVRLDDSLRYAESQFVRAGVSPEVSVVSSDPAVGLATGTITFAPATDTALGQFKPARAGKTTLTLKTPPEWVQPSHLNQVVADVRDPGIAVADDMVIGENLQVAAVLSLGEPAPQGGVDVQLTTDGPDKLLLATEATQIGKPSLTIHMPAGTVNKTYYLQSLQRSGTVKHTGTAPGYKTRTGTLTLMPSGVILTPEKHGPPDEAEVFRPESAGSHRNLVVALLSEKKPTSITVYTAYLDPKTLRSADITVQPLRAGLTVTVDLKNGNPDVGTLDTHVTLTGGAERVLVPFRPVRAGETILSVATPPGFLQPSNSTELLAIVRD